MLIELDSSERALFTENGEGGFVLDEFVFGSSFRPLELGPAL